jgi:hypothetical protein
MSFPIGSFFLKRKERAGDGDIFLGRDRGVLSKTGTTSLPVILKNPSSSI